MNQGVLSAVGHTPLVRLTRFLPGSGLNLFAKLEACNIGGSIKDRAAYSIIRCAMERGDVKAGATVIESTSGNMGIGLAQACRVFGLRLICVVDPKITAQNLSILRVYGAEIDLVTKPDPTTGEYLQARLVRVQELIRRIPGSFWTNQYANLDNARSHHRTMREIHLALDGRIDFLFVAASTCGTIRGCADYIAQNDLHTKIVAVDAVGSVIFGGVRAKRLLPGHGAAVRPELFRERMAERVVLVSDLDCVLACRKLVFREAILSGASSGAVMAAVEEVAESIPTDANCVVVLPDRGERYLDTIYSDEWVQSHLDVSPELLANVVTKPPSSGQRLSRPVTVDEELSAMELEGVGAVTP